MVHFDRSRQVVAEVLELVPGGVNSHFRLGAPPNPLVFDRAEGCRLFDVDGNRYVDYCLGMGPVILGHTAQVVSDAVCQQVGRGVLYAGQSELEYRAARLVHDLVPSAESVRFGSSGSEVVQAALRLARAATGRRLVIKFEGHYHGWFDNVFWNVTPAVDEEEHVPRQPVAETMGQLAEAAAGLVVLPWNELDLVEEALSTERVAAVIMEPVMFNNGGVLPRPGFLEGVRTACDRHDALLVFDEIITGFRAAPGGAQEAFGVLPDLTTLGKALGNGFPVAALAGRRDVMSLLADGKVVHGGTYNSQCASMAAVVATLRCLRDPTVWGRITRTGEELIAGLRHVFADHGVGAEVVGFPGVFQVRWPHAASWADGTAPWAGPQAYRELAARLLAYGVRVLPRGTWFCSSAHSDADVAETLAAVETVLDGMLSEQKGER